MNRLTGFIRFSKRVGGLLLAFGLIAVVGNSVVAQETEPAGGPEVFGTGLKEPTPAQLAWMQAHFPEIKRLRANPIALERANAVRRAKGMGFLTEAQVDLAEFGQEAVFNAVAAPATMDAVALAEAVASVDNSADAAFPPIRSQGAIGSCVAWSVTYYQMTYETAKARAWNAKTGGDLYRLSPKWTYNMINGGVDAGAYFSDAYNLELKHGAARWSEFPYDSNYLAWNTNAGVWRGAIDTRVLTQGTVSGTGDTLINNIKAQLVNGHVMVIGTYVNSWVQYTLANDPGTTADDAYAGQKVAGYLANTAQGAHGMTIVGYNDDLWCDLNANGVVDTGEKGALKIANSWGTGDWNSGYRWVAYDAVRSTTSVPGFAPSNRGGAIFYGGPYTITARASYTPKMIATFTLNHAKRNQLYVRLGRSTASQTTPATYWTPGTLYGDGGAYGFTGTSSAVDATFVFDFTDIMSTATRWYVVMQDSTLSNVATSASYVLADVEHGDIQTSAMAPMVPKTADASTAYIYVDYTYTTSAPTITKQPANLTVNPVDVATFTIVATGQAPLSYQWQRSDNGGVSWSDVAGATSSAYTLDPATCADSGAQFRCVVTNASGTATSDAATLTVNCSPAITQQPTNQTVSGGDMATFSVVATGEAPLNYQWQRSDNGGASWTDVAGAMSSAYTLDPATCSDSGARFRCVVTNDYGTATSNAATLTVNCTPAITQQPANQTVKIGQTATFTVVATGQAPLNYQWQRSTNRGKTYTAIAGATSPSYTTPSVTSSDNGARYRCVVSNTYGTVTSNYATLTVRKK